MSHQPLCELCGEPMPPGEEMFKFHGYSGDCPKPSKVRPLTKKTMTLSQLQLRTLDVLRKVRFQFKRQGHEDGMTDEEFLDNVLEPLETDIYQDRHVLKDKKSPAD